MLLTLAGCSDTPVKTSVTDITKEDKTVASAGEAATTTESVDTTAPANQGAETLSEFEKTLIGNTLGENAEFKGYDKLSDAEKAKIIEGAKKEGVDVSFKDGVMTAKEDGGEVQYGDILTDEDLLFGLIPTPAFGKVTMKGTLAEGEYVLMAINVTREQAEEYVKALKKAGFKKNAEVEDDSEDGVYRFSAENSDDCLLDMSFTKGILMVSLTT